MSSLAFKLLLTPALIGIASLAGRRWGTAVSGWLVGLPLTSGPIAFFLALNHGPAFAAEAAAGTLTGAISQAAFCLAYGWLALRWDWSLALTVSCLTFATLTALLQYLALPLALFFLLVIAVLGIALRAMPARAEASPQATNPPPHWDIPARMVIATAFVLLLTGLAPAFGPRLTGLLAPFPLYATILAIFTHRLQGPASAALVLRGLLLGLFAFAGFFLALAALLEPLGIAPAFAAAITIALTIQAGSLWVVRRASARLSLKA
ncbi:MAG TPA: hypothetical protein VF099_05395 [Ktedonobacterales bacterium]